MKVSDLTGRILVTGGAGFIGSAVVRQIIAHTQASVLNVDCLTYAANLANLDSVASHPRYRLAQADIRDADAMAEIFTKFRPDAVMHLAAESHVDRSIDGPAAFIETNIIGTFVLLQASLRYLEAGLAENRDAFRFLHISTDEVFGSLGPTGVFQETTPYQPSSPYSASKASADHLVQAWHTTFGLPMILANCSNNYGPYQFPEKLIPLMIIKAMAGQSLPVYGKGDNVRDWLHVDDHADALLTLLANAAPGSRYNIGGNAEQSNLAVVEQICDLLDGRLQQLPGGPRRALITFVTDRPGHDQRYAMDASKLAGELGWQPRYDFAQGLTATVDWYLQNQSWWRPILDGTYAGDRLGTRRHEISGQA